MNKKYMGTRNIKGEELIYCFVCGRFDAPDQMHWYRDAAFCGKDCLETYLEEERANRRHELEQLLLFGIEPKTEEY